jgi:pimeloyl-ACP methyl ester carboxylesterase
MPDVTIGDVRLSYDVAGEGEPVLLVCGTGQPAYTWQVYQAPALLAAGYQVITFDNRGMPPSDCPPAPYFVKEMVEDAAGIIEHLDVGPCRVAGLSLGAFITQELALAHPELVRSAVMMGTIGRSDVFRRALGEGFAEATKQDEPLPRLAEEVYTALVLYSPHMLNDDVRMQAYLDFAQAAPRWTNPGRHGQFEADRDYGGQNRLEAFGGIRTPSMVIGFELDVLTPAPLSREVAEAIPECTYVEIPQCGHAGPFEQPDEVNRELLAFLART